jgi:hypothetical protein
MPVAELDTTGVSRQVDSGDSLRQFRSSNGRQDRGGGKGDEKRAAVHRVREASERLNGVGKKNAGGDSD